VGLLIGKWSWFTAIPQDDYPASATETPRKVMEELRLRVSPRPAIDG